MFDGCLRSYLTTSGLSFLCFRVTYVLYLNSRTVRDAVHTLVGRMLGGGLAADEDGIQTREIGIGDVEILDVELVAAGHIVLDAVCQRQVIVVKQFHRAVRLVEILGSLFAVEHIHQRVIGDLALIQRRQRVTQRIPVDRGILAHAGGQYFIRDCRYAMSCVILLLMRDMMCAKGG